MLYKVALLKWLGLILRLSMATALNVHIERLYQYF